MNNIIGQEDESIKFETVSSKLTCPKCGEGNVILKIHPVNKRKNFACSNDDCDWDGGSFNQPLERLDSIDYCEVPDCDGITYMRSGQFGDFRTCSNYFKTGCKGKAKKVSKTKKRPKKDNNIKKIKTNLKCPECNSGDVILNKNTKTGRGYFKCSSCNWDGGPFNQSEEVLNTLDYCPVDGCKGLTFMQKGKYGPFKACTYYVKTKCNGGRK